ncbi:gas vesicle protein GvpFL [Mycobacterium sp. 1164966.3]|uniref:GvpL/GvpF family gas vesicle protein n=1 Tax=Mycobacterium sp. 1164966.3 TaxID=1856861 RepID=UPI000801AFDE|nr:GvpL/GvpF family gas vesicle protein [Mycobacterium sp. 1164966.3]OBA82135.1 gas vesicle protein GvpFL [Mycobacterium sp. 1164966.3]
MSTSQETKDRSDRSQNGSAVYVYGIVPGDVEVEESAQGVCDPPVAVDIVHEGDIAALVSVISTDCALGTPEDLQAHAKLLDGTARVAPVLPLRFGAVMTDEEAVAEELLRDHHDEFAQALKALEGQAEYIVKGRYVEKAFLTRLLSENEQAQQLAADIRDKSEDASRNSRIALGELISNAVEAMRETDTKAVIEELDGIAKQVNPRDPTHEWDAVHVALLGEVERQSELEELLERLNENADGRMQLRLLGPLAAYDFVVAGAAEG